ncbi:MAG: polysaccharide biosynthesis C-terminal domain-containing protein [Balneolaceae bacterium]
MHKLRELFSDTLIYGISSVFARFVNYLLVPFHTDVFEPARYGIVGLIYASIAFLNVIFTMGMESAYLRYAKDREEAPHVFKTLQVGLLVAASLFVAVLWLLEPQVLSLLNLDERTAGIYLMMLGILWFDTLSIVPFAELRLVRRSWLFALLRTGHVIVNLFLNFYLILALGYGIEAVFISNLAASAIVTLLIWAFTVPLMKGRWNRDWLQKAFSFGWPFVPAGIGYAVNEMLDRFFLNAMDPEQVQAIYGPGYTAEDIVGIYIGCYKVAVFMLLLIQMFRMAWQPFFMRHSEDADAPVVFARVFIYFNLVAAGLYLFVGLFAQEIVALPIPGTDATLINSRYWTGLEIIPLLLLAYWFHGWYINFSAGIFISKKTVILPKIMLAGAVITIAANLALVPYLGMMGSAWATTASYGTMALSLHYFSTKEFSVPYSLRYGMILMVLMVAIVWSVPALSSLSGKEAFTIKLTLFFPAVLALVWQVLAELKKDRNML